MENSKTIIGICLKERLKELAFERPAAGVNMAEWNRGRSGKAKLTLNQSISGKHDIYLVFRNDKANKTDIIFFLINFDVKIN